MAEIVNSYDTAIILFIEYSTQYKKLKTLSQILLSLNFFCLFFGSILLFLKNKKSCSLFRFFLNEKKDQGLRN